MDLESIIQREVSQQEKNKYHINTYMWNLGKCIDALMCKAEIETQMERTDIWIPKGKWSGQEERGDWN